MYTQLTIENPVDPDAISLPKVIFLSIMQFLNMVVLLTIYDIAKDPSVGGLVSFGFFSLFGFSFGVLFLVLFFFLK